MDTPDNYCMFLLSEIEDELKAQKSYQEAIEQTNDQEAKDLFRSIIEDESKHAKELTELFLKQCT